MKTWGEELTAEAKIQRGIFQGDALSSLLFIIAMMLLNNRENAQPDTNLVGRRKRSITKCTWINEKELETLIHTEYTVRT